MVGIILSRTEFGNHVALQRAVGANIIPLAILKSGLQVRTVVCTWKGVGYPPPPQLPPVASLSSEAGSLGTKLVELLHGAWEC